MEWSFLPLIIGQNITFSLMVQGQIVLILKWQKICILICMDLQNCLTMATHMQTQNLKFQKSGVRTGLPQAVKWLTDFSHMLYILIGGFIWLSLSHTLKSFWLIITIVRLNGTKRLVFSTNGAQLCQVVLYMMWKEVKLMA